MQDNNTDAIGVDAIIDSIKAFYDQFNNVRSPILRDQKKIFNVFYENDIKYRQILRDVALMETALGEKIDSLKKTNYRKYLEELGKGIKAIHLKVKEEERFDLMLHRGNRYIQTVDFEPWSTLFTIENSPIKEACTLFQMTVQYFKEKKDIAKVSVQIDLTQSFNQLTESEIELIECRSYDESELNQKNIERALQILEPFKTKYNYEPDFELMDKLRSTDSTNSTLKPNQAEGSEPKVKPSELTFEDLFPSVDDMDMVMKMLQSLKIINAEGKYLLGNRTGIIRVFIDVMKEEGCFVDIERKKILRVFTPKILGRLVETIKKPDNYEALKRQILKKYAELKK